MASRVINRSKATMDVLVSTAAGDRIIFLEPGQQNNAAVTPRAVRPSSNFDRLMGGNDWLEILTEMAVIYDFKSIATTNAFVPITHSSLHCLPFSPLGQGPFAPGYRELAIAPTAPAHEPPQPVEQATVADARDGEFNMPGQPFFGKYVRTKLHDGKTYISVRLQLRRFDVTPKELETIQAEWKLEIETVWNLGAKSSTGQEYRFEVEWNRQLPHSTVYVFKHSDRPSMFTWSLDMGKGNFVSPVAAHEYGHHLGLSDGYHYQGEIPGLANEMIQRTSEYVNKTIVPTRETELWSLIGGSVISTRVAERITRGLLPHAPNLMNGDARIVPLKDNPGAARSVFSNDERRNGLVPVSLVDQELIDAIENQALQPLFLDVGEYVSHEAYADTEESIEGYFSVK